MFWNFKKDAYRHKKGCSCIQASIILFFIYLFISLTVGTLTGYLSITKLYTKGRKVIAKYFLN